MLSKDEPTYRGEEIDIFEWPIGCEIVHRDSYEAVLIRSPDDAQKIIESLEQFIRVSSP